ncbi:MAG: CCA tRNA nucleotidyltransferase [Candidatus Omnitrophica bacterium]|nr:CCA tRNA nucleotidyltransferase [Candidatus Omnitrophota bacterium]
MDEKKTLALGIVRQLVKNGFTAYFAGGCVRDMAMKRAPADYDIATDATPNQLKKRFKKTVFVGAEFGTVLVVNEGAAFQVTTFRGKGRGEFSKDPETDAQNRDFTINALFYDPLKKKVIDYCGGLSDIKKKIIRTIQAPEICFSQDPLRPLRAIRISSRLGFDIEKNTFAAIKKFRNQLNSVSKERIKDELVKIFTGPDPYKGMQLLDGTGLLVVLLPEVEALKGVEQPEKFHPEGDVFVHTMLLIKQLKNADIVLAFACLLHDVGKPGTFERTDRIRFHGHDRLGAQIAENILMRLRFSNDEIKKITYCIDNHMRIINVTKMRESTLKRMFLEETFETELLLHKYDCMASHKDMTIYDFLTKKYSAFKRRKVLPKPVMDGHQIMEFGFKEGPIIGKIQKEMVDLQLEGKIKSRQKAKEWLLKKWMKKRPQKK